MKPTDPIKCLLIQPEFSAFSFWNYVDSARTIGAKTPSPPLGLLTVAAILPQHWQFRLLDLNTRPFDEAAWQWADLVGVGGMLPQQKGILAIIGRARAEGKFVVVGGADPSSQPHLYQHADALIVGEGESAIPVWLQSWQAGTPRGLFKETEKPDLTQSPVPRFDLLQIKDYVQIGVQYSRGCPFNCEFCDIIELFGRKPRTKTAAQILTELTAIKKLGYTGSIDLVDDNFIGNKRQVKRQLLPALIEWNRQNRHPFYFCTEASMNLADDHKLLELMRDADFRVIFMGIETPDPELLLMTQKTQNTMQPISQRVHTLYQYGMVVTAGFIMGFDGEKSGMDRRMIDLINECQINMAMVGLLVALPNTQLSRRLLKEGRLLSFRGKRLQCGDDMTASASADDSMTDVIDQTIAGLNFITTRSRLETLVEYQNVVRAIYAPRSYFDRALRVGKALRMHSRHRPGMFELKRNLIGFLRLSVAMSRDPSTCFLYWRNILHLFWRGPHVFEQVMRLLGIYLHFKRQTAYLCQTLDHNQAEQRQIPDALPPVQPHSGRLADAL